MRKGEKMILKGKWLYGYWCKDCKKYFKDGETKWTEKCKKCKAKNKQEGILKRRKTNKLKSVRGLSVNGR
jgi:Zn finger protein HypA/HybF involved in hydrogenase expression